MQTIAPEIGGVHGQSTVWTFHNSQMSKHNFLFIFITLNSQLR